MGPKGELIAVGGPFKSLNPSEVGDRLVRLKKVADANNVQAAAYFEEGTPASVIALAQKHLGEGNVHTFSR